jgi:hypothetical protein
MGTPSSKKDGTKGELPIYWPVANVVNKSQHRQRASEMCLQLRHTRHGLDCMEEFTRNVMRNLL